MVIVWRYQPSTTESKAANIEAQEHPEKAGHNVLEKNNTLVERICEATADEKKLTEEFHRLEKEVAETICEPCNVARLGTNVAHNRYADIGEYDI